jgi:hypothetical protein
LRSNQATVEYPEAVVTAEGIDIVGAVGNPTASGIHAKWLLACVDGVTWSAVDNLNGGEISHKVKGPRALPFWQSGLIRRHALARQQLE